MRRLSSYRLWAATLFLMTLSHDPAGAHEVAPAIPNRAVDAPAVGPRAAVQSIRTVINGVTLIYQGAREPVEVAPIDPETEFDAVLGVEDAGQRAPESKVLMGDNALDQILFGQGWTAETAAGRFYEALYEKIEACDQIVGLTVAQRNKLRLAGRGDIVRLFEKISRHRSKIETLAERIDGTPAFMAWLRQLNADTKALQKKWSVSPFENGSLFAKTLATMVSPEQMVAIGRRRSSPVRFSSPPDTVHVFQNVEINRVRKAQVAPAGFDDLERPDLQGLRQAAKDVQPAN